MTDNAFFPFVRRPCLPCGKKNAPPPQIKPQPVCVGKHSGLSEEASLHQASSSNLFPVEEPNLSRAHLDGEPLSRSFPPAPSCIRFCAEEALLASSIPATCFPPLLKSAPLWEELFLEHHPHAGVPILPESSGPPFFSNVTTPLFRCRKGGRRAARILVILLRNCGCRNTFLFH